MFIGARRKQRGPPSGGPCQSLKTRDALYKHGPPGGGRARRVAGSINIALLTEGIALLPEGRRATSRVL